MKKPQQIFECSHCGAQSSKWAGQCAECGKWGTIAVGAQGRAPGANNHSPLPKPGKTQAFSELVAKEQTPKTPTGYDPLDRLLSGGLVSGSVTLLGGEPGIGKSTLLAQTAIAKCKTQNAKSVIYVTGEESPSQVALRLKRLSPSLPDGLLFLDETDAAVIASTIESSKPALVIVDSVQTIRHADVPGEPGNPTQIKAASALVTAAAKSSGVSVILVGQVTKDGDLAGPRLLEHLVDAVLMMEGDRSQAFRLLRVLKNRFGPTDDVTLFAMKESGLEEVIDPSAALLADRPKNVPGTVVSCLIEGSRPLLVEVQALVTPAGYGTPLRRVSGVDLNRTALLLAVMGRRGGVGFGDQDAFVNTIGGMEAKDPSVDLAVCLALASAKADKPLPDDLVAWGEVGLAGELRPVPRLDARLKEAARLGFKTALIPTQKDAFKTPEGMSAIQVSNLREAIRRFIQTESRQGRVEGSLRGNPSARQTRSG
ncbi:MAG: DNA repair protein RadA [Ignavibacteriota bacterium]|nr:MAG: DNA repair protein RadA [Candidatus Uhrbacteria bacterium]QKJ94798.1 MAG: DNA repair protein RadA [Ignavibacteriota bacterium]